MFYLYNKETPIHKKIELTIDNNNMAKKIILGLIFGLLAIVFVFWICRRVCRNVQAGIDEATTQDDIVEVIIEDKNEDSIGPPPSYKESAD